jgi:hypothetical protein
METFDQNLVADAVKDALKLGAPSFDAVKQLILCRIEKRPPRLDLAAYPYLPNPPSARRAPPAIRRCLIRRRHDRGHRQTAAAASASSQAAQAANRSRRI